MFTILPRALLAFAFVWLVMPHQPDLGLGRPLMIETTVARVCQSNCDRAALAEALGPFAILENSHNTLLDTIARVRSDLRANGTHIGALSRNGAP